jgi:hypothetical protein
VFPAHPERGDASGSSLIYRTAAALEASELTALDEAYKSRWPNNENPIKALVAVGFDRNLDRTLDPASSRRADGAVNEAREEVRVLDEQLESLGDRTLAEAGKLYVGLLSRREKKQAKAERAEQAQRKERAGEKASRSDRGAEHLCKALMLMLFNALSMLLHSNPSVAAGS